MWYGSGKPSFSRFFQKFSGPWLRKIFTCEATKNLTEFLWCRLMSQFCQKIDARKPAEDSGEVSGGLKRLRCDSLMAKLRDSSGRSRQTFFSIMDPRIFRKNLKFKVFEGRVTSRVYCSMAGAFQLKLDCWYSIKMILPLWLKTLEGNQ